MKAIVLVALAGALFAAGCTGAKDATPGKTISSQYLTPPATVTRPPAESTVAATEPTSTPCTSAQTGGNKTYKSAPPMTIDVNKTYIATIKMDIGDITLELFAKDAPVTVNSFVFLARDRFYDGLTFHRVIPGFVAQGGDPTGTGGGGPGYSIKDEISSHKFLDGTIGMAKSSRVVETVASRNSPGSQFFIDYTPQPSLDGLYTAFGQVTAGRDVLDKIAPRDPSTATCPGTKINTIEITEK